MPFYFHIVLHRFFSLGNSMDCHELQEISWVKVLIWMCFALEQVNQVQVLLDQIQKWKEARFAFFDVLYADDVAVVLEVSFAH